MPDEALHNTLRVQRAIRDLTQAELAERAGVTRKSVNAIEAGRMVPSVLLALKLARVLGVSVETLFTLDDPSATSPDEARHLVSRP
jgi:putative transcriptional regulator